MAAVGRVDNVVVLSGELFDAIEVNAARTGNHKRAAVRMSRLAVQATAGGMSRAEAHMRAGEQWLLADDPTEAVEQFEKAIADGGPTFDDPRVSLARAMFALGRTDDADALLREVRESGARTLPRTCDLVAELLTEQGDLEGALDWATAGVDACLAGEDRDELQLLLRLRYRLRVDLGLPEDDYDKLLDEQEGRPRRGQLKQPRRENRPFLCASERPRPVRNPDPLDAQRVPALVHVDHHLVAVTDLAGQQRPGQLVAHGRLHQAAQRPRAVHRVEAGQRQPLPGRGGDGQRQPPPGQPRGQLVDLQVHDPGELAGGQRVEDDHVVEPVQELGLEGRTHRASAPPPAWPPRRRRPGPR